MIKKLLAVVKRTQREHTEVGDGPVLLDEKGHAPKEALGLSQVIWRGDTEVFLTGLPAEPLYDLVVVGADRKLTSF